MKDKVEIVPIPAPPKEWAVMFKGERIGEIFDRNGTFEAYVKVDGWMRRITSGIGTPAKYDSLEEAVTRSAEVYHFATVWK